MTKKQRQAEQILRHGLALKRIFNLPGANQAGYIGPVTLCKKLRRLENRAQRINLSVCTEEGYEPPADWDLKILRAADKLLHFVDSGIPVFLNHDPRGCALKIDSDYVRAHRLAIYTDWGGYGLIAPELDGDFTAYGVGKRG